MRPMTILRPLPDPRSWLSACFAGSALMLAVLLCLPVRPCTAEVFHSKESALRLAFPRADRVDKQEIFLRSDQAERVERLSKTRLPSRMISVYVGYEDDELLGFAFIETHKVRSMPETVLVVIDPDGHSSAVHMLAVHEPPEYAPPGGWLNQFEHQELDDELRLRADIAGIAGSTLTATAITAAVRRVMAVHEVGVAPIYGDTRDYTQSDVADVAR